MTSPVEEVAVRCPRCEHEYRDWFRASLNLSLEHFDEEYIREATTATCPLCGYVVVLASLIVEPEGVE